MKVQESKKYSQFKIDLTNRPINAQHVKKLVVSIKKHGYLPAYPIMVARNGAAGFTVLDGQHRFEAAKALGLAIHFVVHEGQISIPEINEPQSRWTNSDYIGSYANQGNADYHFLREFSARTKISPLRAASLLYGEMAASGNVSDALKAGKFKVRDVEYADRVASIVAVISKSTKWAATLECIGAISRLVRVSKFDDAIFIKRVEANRGMLTQQATIELYSKLFEEIYNMRNRNPVPLAFLANEEMRRRNASTKKSA